MLQFKLPCPTQIWSHYPGLEIATSAVTNATNIFSLATKNAPLAEIDEKLERLLKLTDEFQTYKSQVKSLEDEQKNMQESLGS